MGGETLPIGTGWSGNYSRSSYDPAKAYVMVLKEQGVPLLDDELNHMQLAQIDLLRKGFATICGDGAFGTGLQVVGTGAINDFTIKAGTLLVDGWMIKTNGDITYNTQPIAQATLTMPGTNRTDEVYLEIWLDEINSIEDTSIVDPTLGTRTSCRLKLKWSVKVAEGTAVPASGLDVGSNTYYWRYRTATIYRTAINTITAEMVTDRRAVIRGIAGEATLVEHVSTIAAENTTGHVSLATAVEALAGFVANKAITPATLKAVLDAFRAHLVGAAPELLNQIDEISAALANDPNFATTMMTLLAAKAPLISPDFTGPGSIPLLPTAAPGTNTKQGANCEFVKTAIANAKGLEATLTDAANITWDWSAQSNAKVTLGGNRTLSAPSNLAAGEYACIRVAQDATGGRVLSFASNYKGVVDVSLSTDANAVDWLLFRAVDAANCELVGYRTNVGA